MRRYEGLTLVEVLVAVTILSVGVIAGLGMQTSALGATSKGNIAQNLTNLAEAEMDMQRQLATPTAGTTCLSGVITGYTCKATVVPCSLSGSNMTCVAGASSPVAYQTTINVAGPRNASFSLTVLLPSSSL